MAVLAIAGTILQNVEARGLMVTDSFRLHPDFAGEYTAEKVHTRTISNAAKAEDEDAQDAANAFTVEFHGEGGKRIMLPDWMLLRSRVVATDDEVQETFKDKVAYYDDNQALVAKSSSFSMNVQRDDNGKPISLGIPEKIAIKGALTSKVKDADDTEHPAIPLRNYRGYDAVLSFYKAELKQEEPDEDHSNAFINRDQFSEYLRRNSNGDITIPGVDKELDGLELKDTRLADEMSVWSSQLVVADLSTAKKTTTRRKKK